MGATIGQSSPSLEKAPALTPRSERLRGEALLRLLREEPFSVQFFQAVRLLERLFPQRSPVGYFVSPAGEVVRFSARTSLNFPASEVHTFREVENAPHAMEINFLGLTTINGPLPHPYAEHMLERQRAKDHGPQAFFDLFNHRFVSLFYRAWKKYRFHIGYELASTHNTAATETRHEDPITESLYSLIGLGTAGLRHRTAVPDEALLFYAGLLGRSVRTAQSLKQLLADFFSIPVQIEEFTGSWNPLSEEDLTYLRDSGSMSEQLGIGTMVGDAVWDTHGTVGVRLGPMGLKQYRDFLPGGRAARQLADWIRLFGRGEFDFAVRLVLAREEVPGVALSTNENEMGTLGFTSWLKNKPCPKDAEDAVYRLH